MSALEQLAQAVLDGRVSLVAYETRDEETGYWIQVEPEPETNAPLPQPRDYR